MRTGEKKRAFLVSRKCWRNQRSENPTLDTPYKHMSDMQLRSQNVTISTTEQPDYSTGRSSPYEW